MSGGSAISSITEPLGESGIDGVPNIEGGDSDTIFLSEIGSAECRERVLW